MKTSLGISTLNQNGLKAYFRNIKITQLWKNHTVGTNILFVNKIHVAQAKLLKKKKMMTRIMTVQRLTQPERP